MLDCLQCGRPRFDPWVRKMPWRRKWQPTPVLLPGKFHGWRSLVGYSPWGRKESDMTEWVTSLLSLSFFYIRRPNLVQWFSQFFWKLWAFCLSFMNEASGEGGQRRNQIKTQLLWMKGSGSWNPGSWHATCYSISQEVPWNLEPWVPCIMQLAKHQFSVCLQSLRQHSSQGSSS